MAEKTNLCDDILISLFGLPSKTEDACPLCADGVVELERISHDYATCHSCGAKFELDHDASYDDGSWSTDWTATGLLAS